MSTERTLPALPLLVALLLLTPSIARAAPPEDGTGAEDTEAVAPESETPEDDAPESEAEDEAPADEAPEESGPEELAPEGEETPAEEEETSVEGEETATEEEETSAEGAAPDAEVPGESAPPSPAEEATEEDGTDGEDGPPEPPPFVGDREPPPRGISFGRDGHVILTPRGFWLSRMTGEIRSGRDGAKGTRLELRDRSAGLGLQTDVVVSPHVDLEFPGRIGSRRFRLHLAFWWRNYQGTTQPDASQVGDPFVFHSTDFPADGRVYTTDLTVLSVQIRLGMEIWRSGSARGPAGLSFDGILEGILYHYAIEVNDRFVDGIEDDDTLTGVWPSVGVRASLEPAWWFRMHVEAIGTHLSLMHAFGMRVTHGELRGGILVRWASNWGVAADLTWTVVDLERDRTRDGRSHVDVGTIGPSVAVYAKF